MMTLPDAGDTWVREGESFKDREERFVTAVDNEMVHFELKTLRFPKREAAALHSQWRAWAEKAHRRRS